MDIEKIKGSTLFVVDDNKENLKVLVQYLSGLDLMIVPLISGEQLLELMRVRTPDLILLDIIMPGGIDGYETCSRLKANSTYDDIPVIFMSALSDTFDKVKGFKQGAVDYVTKPIEIEELLSRINTHLSIRHLQKDLVDINTQLEEKVMARTKELVIAKEKAEESDRLKSEFLASMSHEIRTPLNSIVGFSGLIADDAEDSESKEYAEIINKQNELLLKIIDDILDLAKVESGKLEMFNREFDLVKFVDNLVQIFERECPQNINLIPKVDTAVKMVCTDPDRLKQIFSNLLSNSIKFTEKGQIKFGYTLDKDHKVIFHVADTGIGIPEDKRDIIFDRFAKLDKFTQGTGLGLAIVKTHFR